MMTGAANATTVTNVELTLGQMRIEQEWTTQVIAVKNNDSYPISTLWVECGFYQNGQLVGANQSYANNIAPGTTAFLEVTKHITADKARCRVSEVHQ
jgi:hypothetical protein